MRLDDIVDKDIERNINSSLCVNKFISKYKLNDTDYLQCRDCRNYSSKSDYGCYIPMSVYTKYEIKRGL